MCVSVLHLREWPGNHLEYKDHGSLGNSNYYSRVFRGFYLLCLANTTLGVVNLPCVFLAEANEKQMFTSGNLVLGFIVAVK